MVAAFPGLLLRADITIALPTGEGMAETTQTGNDYNSIITCLRGLL